MQMNDKPTEQHPTKHYPALALKQRPEFWSFQDMVLCYLLALKQVREAIAVHRPVCGPGCVRFFAVLESIAR